MAGGRRSTITEYLVVHVVVAGLLLVAGLFRLTAWAHISPPRSVRTVVSTCRSSIPFLGVDVAEFVTGRADVWLSAWAFAAADASRYSTASVLAYQVAVPVGLANVALGPTVARLWRAGQRDQLRHVLDAVSTLATIFTLAAVAVLWVLGPTVMSTIFGADLRGAGVLTAILATGLVGFGAFGSCTVLLLITGHARRAMTPAFAVLAIAIPFGILIAFTTGPRTLAVVSAASSVALAASQVVACRSTLGVAPMPRLDVAGAIRTLRSRPSSGDAVLGVVVDG